jgi:hypothetical protein
MSDQQRSDVEQTTPLDVIRGVIFPIAAIANLNPPGSYERAVAELAARGIRDKLEWAIRCLEMAGEGKKGYPLDRYPVPSERS